MRVFEQFSFNLKDKVKFKDTKEYVEQFLMNNNIYYDNIAFKLSCGNHDKLLNKYPTMNKYLKTSIYNPVDKDLSSVPLGWADNPKIHIEKEDEKLLDEICKKIPRPYNFGFISVLLDNVHWFPDSNTSPTNTVHINPNVFSFENYLSNSIQLKKEFDYGNKYNLIEVKIERTKSFDELIDISDLVNKLSNAFGKPTEHYLTCSFENGEKQAKTTRDHDFKKIEEHLNPKEFFKEFHIPNPKTSEEIHNKVLEELELPKGISPKKSMVQQGKNYGFKYKKFHLGQYIMQKTNINNHIFEVEFLMIPLTCKFEARVGIIGYNFKRYFWCEQTMLKQQSDADKFIKKVFDYAHMIEEQYSDTLLELYGKTPKWFNRDL